MKSKITITIDENLLEELEVLAEKESRSVSSLINKIVKDYLEGK